MSLNFTTIIYLFNILTLLVVAVMLVLINTAPELRKLKYHKAKRCLSVAVFIVALGQIMMFFDGTMENQLGIFPISILLVAAFQACLFTFLVLILFHSSYVSTRNILKHLLPTAIFITLYIIAIIIRDDVEVHTLSEYITHITNPALLLRTAFVITYGIQLVVYILLFKHERKRYLEQIDEHFSDTSHLRLRWSTRLFYQAAAIGVIVLLFSVKPTFAGDVLLTAFLPIFYGAFAVRFINFQYSLPFVISAVAKDNMVYNEEIKVDFNDTDENAEEQLCCRVKHLLESEPIYLTKGLVITDVADRLKVSKRTLSNCINSVYCKNFNRWINSMRIEYAKSLIDLNPELPLTEVAEQSGFADSAMLSKEFKRHVGTTPSLYRKNIVKGE